MTKQHVVVVGGGIVGCMTAMALVQRGCKVTIVERHQIASQTSGESSWAGGGILFPLLPWMYSSHVNLLTLSGAAFYRDLSMRMLEETGIDVNFIQSGFLILPSFDASAAKTWASEYSFLIETTQTSAFDLPLRVENEALWFPEVCQIRPPYLMQALRVWLEKNQVTLLENTALLPLKETENLKQWTTTDGRTLEADQFVVTSGAWSFELLKETAANFKIKPMRGQILLFKPKKNISQILYKEGFYMIPRQDGYLLAGSTLEDVGFNAGVTDEKYHEIRAKAEDILPSLAGEAVIKHWSGLRPGTPENMPIISAHPSINHLFLNTGHFRYGLTMAPSSASLIAEIMCGETPHINPVPFQLS